MQVSGGGEAPGPGARTTRQELLLFLVSGGSAALLNLGVGAGVRAALGAERRLLSVVAGFLAGTVLSFVMNRELTFRARRDSLASQMVRFGLIAAASIPVAAGIAEGAYRAGAWALGARLDEPTLASASHVFAVGVMPVLNFIAMKFFALRR